MTRDVEVLADAEAAARRAAALIAERIRNAVADAGRAAIAFSGGRTPIRTMALLSEEDVPWEHLTIFQVDERVAPRGHPDRNLTQLEDALRDAHIVPMPVEDADAEAAAARYAAALPERLDLVQLGLGTDGHTASLFAGDPALEIGDRDVAMTGERHGRRRMTLTLPALDRAREAVWIVTGGDKREPLRRLLAEDSSIPAARVRTSWQTVLADRAAGT